MTFKTDIWVTHAYGYYEIRFSKVFNLRFAPFPGLIISEHTDDYELDIELTNNDYVSTRIYYHANKNEFEVNVRRPWKHPVTDEAIDSTIAQFEKAGWQRGDQTDINDLKALMKRDYEWQL